MKAKNGFTLIELLVVVAIISLLTSVIIASLTLARMKARDANRIATARSLKTALALWEDKSGTIIGINSGGSGNMMTVSATTSKSIIDVLVQDDTLQRKIASDSIFGMNTYYLGICADGRYDVFTKLERTESAQASTTLSAGCDGTNALALGYNYSSGGGGGAGLAGVAAGSGGGGGGGIAAIYSGADASMALTASGDRYAWGDNNAGIFGTGATSPATSTITLVDTGKQWSSIAMGKTHAIAIRSDGTLWGWGSGTYGENGANTGAAQLTPKQIGTDTNWASVSVSLYSSFAIKTNGELWSWGRNDYGQLGQNTSGSPVLVPAKITTPAETWKIVAGGDSNSIGAITTTGKLYTWGYNGNTELGNGNTNTQVAPARIGTFTDWTSVSMGYYHGVGMRGSGLLYTWGGYNAFGQLGNSSAAVHLDPTQIQGGTVWASAEAGAYSGYAISTAGKLFSWGSNSNGQLGWGAGTPMTNNARPDPTEVLPSGGWTKISVGSNTVLATRGSAYYAWGNNATRQLGDGTNTNQPAPVLITVP